MKILQINSIDIIDTKMYNIRILNIYISNRMYSCIYIYKLLLFNIYHFLTQILV